MPIQRTLSIIKPDAVQKRRTGAILGAIEDAKLRIVAMRKLHLSLDEARGFYAVHRKRPFFDELTKFMSSAPVVVSVLEGEDAIARYRKLMGDTDSRRAALGTLRRRFGSNIGENAVHGSDAEDTAAEEIRFFFAARELLLAERHAH